MKMHVLYKYLLKNFLEAARLTDFSDLMLTTTPSVPEYYVTAQTNVTYNTLDSLRMFVRKRLSAPKTETSLVANRALVTA